MCWEVDFILFARHLSQRLIKKQHAMLPHRGSIHHHKTMKPPKVGTESVEGGISLRHRKQTVHRVRPEQLIRVPFPSSICMLCKTTLQQEKRLLFEIHGQGMDNIAYLNMQLPCKMHSFSATCTNTTNVLLRQNCQLV